LNRKDHLHYFALALASILTVDIQGEENTAPPPREEHKPAIRLTVDRLQGDVDGSLHGRVRDLGKLEGQNDEGIGISVSKAGDAKTVKTESLADGSFEISIPAAWRQDLTGRLDVTAKKEEASLTEKFEVRAFPYSFLPPDKILGRLAVTDEPVGARHSLGLTLWHTGRAPEFIRRFHAFLKDKGLSPQKLLKPEELEAPERLREILLEPELLPADQRHGWKVDHNYITSTALDAGPSFRFKAEISRPGPYAFWIRFVGWHNGTSLTRVRIYRADSPGSSPVLDDEFGDLPEQQDGPTWKRMQVDLDKGAYTFVFSHKTRWWHVSKKVAYKPRRIDSFYLTEEIWAEAPSEAHLKKIRKRVKPQGIQRNWNPRLAKADQERWGWWQVRPISWEDRNQNPQLFRLSYGFWRREADRVSRMPFERLPDYRDVRRQVIFDDVWNMVANPARIRRQWEALLKDIDLDSRGHFYSRIDASRVSKRLGGRSGDWWATGRKLVSGTYYNFKGAAWYEKSLELGKTYYFWVQFRNQGYHEPWQITVWPESDKAQSIHWKRDKRRYQNDIEPKKSWVKVGSVKMKEDLPGNNLVWQIKDLRWRGLKGVSYRWIWAYFITTDPDFVPKGSVTPPTTRDQYLSNAKAVGVNKEDGYLLQIHPASSSMPQTWWPKSKIDFSPSMAVDMAPETVHSFQIRLRSISDRPISVGVTCAPLRGQNGSIQDRVNWRVIGFVPYGNTRATWNSFCLMRRPYINIPPSNAAGIWVSVNTKSVPPGEYKSKILLRGIEQSTGREFPVRSIDLRIRVSPIRIGPKTPVIVHGYTMPPEGKAYLEDFLDHGIKVWSGSPLSKVDMDRYGIRIQQVRARSSKNQFKGLLDSLNKLGLTEEDYYLIVWDEPSGKTESQLRKFTAAAKAIRAINPKARIAFNPGEPATLATFQILDPHCDIWMPFNRHFVYHPKEAAAKKKIITSKPWMDYTTPCYYDKEPRFLSEMYRRIRAVPARGDLCMGTWFFALYYPWRDPWDTGYEHIKDVSVCILPSRLGPVPTMTWESIREAIQHADLAQMVKESAAKDDKEAQKLVSSGSISHLLRWLEKNRSGRNP